MQDMVIQMNDEQFLTLAQLQAFLDGTLASNSHGWSTAALDTLRFASDRYERLASISVAHLYNLRKHQQILPLPSSAPYCRAR